jgi:hypothetical protein
MQHGVQQGASMSVRENESVATSLLKHGKISTFDQTELRGNARVVLETYPLGILGAVLHELIPEQIRHGSHTHGSTRVTTVGLLNGVSAAQERKNCLVSFDVDWGCRNGKVDALVEIGIQWNGRHQCE